MSCDHDALQASNPASPVSISTRLLSIPRRILTFRYDSIRNDGKLRTDSPRSFVLAHPAALQSTLLVAVCGLWMTLSSVLILISKHILVDLHFPYPIALSAYGMAFSAVASFICCKVLKVAESTTHMSTSTYMSFVVPTGFFSALTLLTGNVVYLHLTVSFIQMLKACTPVITMLALFVFRMEDPTPSLCNSVVMISLGTAAAAFGEVQMSIKGVGYLLISSVAEALRLVSTQILLQGYKFNTIEAIMWLAPASAVWLLLGVAVFELQSMLSYNALQVVVENKWEFLLAMCLGFCVNLLAYMIIKLSSSLTLKVLATVKNTLLVFVGIIVLKEVVTWLQGVGYVVSLVGFIWYNYLKGKKSICGPNAEDVLPAVHSPCARTPISGGMAVTPRTPIKIHPV